MSQDRTSVHSNLPGNFKKHSPNEIQNISLTLTIKFNSKTNHLQTTTELCNWWDIRAFFVMMPSHFKSSIANDLQQSRDRIVILKFVKCKSKEERISQWTDRDITTFCPSYVACYSLSGYALSNENKKEINFQPRRPPLQRLRTFDRVATIIRGWLPLQSNWAAVEFIDLQVLRVTRRIWRIELMMRYFLLFPVQVISYYTIAAVNLSSIGGTGIF